MPNQPWKHSDICRLLVGRDMMGWFSCTLTGCTHQHDQCCTDGSCEMNGSNLIHCIGFVLRAAHSALMQFSLILWTTINYNVRWTTAYIHKSKDLDLLNFCIVSSFFYVKVDRIKLWHSPKELQAEQCREGLLNLRISSHQNRRQISLVNWLLQYSGISMPWLTLSA